VRIAFFGDTVDDIAEIDPLRGKVLRSCKRVEIYPGSHYVTPKRMISQAINPSATSCRSA
jgi:excinuclease ABC subunit B